MGNKLGWEYDEPVNADEYENVMGELELGGDEQVSCVDLYLFTM